MKTIFLSALLLVCVNSYTQKLTPDEQRIKKVFFNFLLFYKKNEKKFNSFKLYSGSGKENNPPYRINWNTGVKQYFNYLRKNVPFVGEAYIKAETGHFKNAEQNFKEYPDEEIAMGFDYDRWAGGQEDIDYTYKWYTSPANTYKVIIKGNKATLRIGSSIEKEGDTQFWSVVPFVKEKGKWKMADNIYPEDE